MKNRAGNIFVVILGAIAIIGILLVVETYLNFNNRQQVVITYPTKSTLKPDKENWLTYSNNNLGVEFEYPESLKLQETSDSVRVNRNMGYLFEVKKTKFNSSVEDWWAQESKNFVPFVMSGSTFKDKPAYFFKENTAEVQIPEDFYAVKMPGHILTITFQTPYNLELYTEQERQTYSHANLDFNRDTKPIVDRILSTFKFLGFEDSKTNPQEEQLYKKQRESLVDFGTGFTLNSGSFNIPADWLQYTYNNIDFWIPPGWYFSENILTNYKIEAQKYVGFPSGSVKCDFVIADQISDSELEFEKTIKLSDPTIKVLIRKYPEPVMGDKYKDLFLIESGANSINIYCWALGDENRFKNILATFSGPN